MSRSKWRCRSILAFALCVEVWLGWCSRGCIYAVDSFPNGFDLFLSSFVVEVFDPTFYVDVSRIGRGLPIAR